MPDTAASPAEDTITVSAMPTVTSKSCSTISGRISRQSDRAVNIGRSGAFHCTAGSPFSFSKH